MWAQVLTREGSWGTKARRSKWLIQQEAESQCKTGFRIRQPDEQGGSQKSNNKDQTGQTQEANKKGSDTQTTGKTQWGGLNRPANQIQLKHRSNQLGGRRGTGCNTETGTRTLETFNRKCTRQRVQPPVQPPPPHAPYGPSIVWV